MVKRRQDRRSQNYGTPVIMVDGKKNQTPKYWVGGAKTSGGQTLWVEGQTTSRHGCCVAEVGCVCRVRVGGTIVGPFGVYFKGSSHVFHHIVLEIWISVAGGSRCEKESSSRRVRYSFAPKCAWCAFRGVLYLVSLI